MDVCLGWEKKGRGGSRFISPVPSYLMAADSMRIGSDDIFVAVAISPCPRTSLMRAIALVFFGFPLRMRGRVVDALK